uniref:ANK_REP_REGION domain-containing protein n=1 Tax=Gongylonema pulchrum TaxID=637853 RepID=A0A183EGM9_9BILA
LHLALRRSHIDIALLLITKGCKLDIQDKNGDTALHIAARIGLLSAVQTLCHLGASVDIPNQWEISQLRNQTTYRLFLHIPKCKTVKILSSKRQLDGIAQNTFMVQLGSKGNSLIEI